MGSQVRLHNLTARFISTALSVFLDELAHRARHIELAGEPRRSTSHLVWGYGLFAVEGVGPRM
ncbi:hypothetical protein [Streptomyces lunaelactis]|uniref:hypothetical protein n=1 Tax=Streptomyces lunaelactis TaxID=1535768 RepID=UPI001584B1B9|nr:hypothetical protein [Streptomyces lunaelactis]NUK14346.1 hypothetical protein [Streptomyces lunaelactis]